MATRLDALAFLRRYLPTGGSLAANTAIATFWQLVRVGVQLLWTIVIARSLGISDYGRLAGIVGFAALLATFTGIGFALLMLQEVVRDPARLGACWRRSWTAILALGGAMTLLFAGIGPLALGGHAQLFLLAGVTELICLPLTMACSYAFQAHGRMGVANLIYVFIPAANLLAGLTFVASRLPRDLDHYIYFHAAFASIATAAACMVVVRLLRPGGERTPWSRQETREAAGFSMMRLADSGLNAFDKAIVLRLAGTEVTGAYTAALRVVTVLALPVGSLAMSAVPRLFRAHADSEQDPSGFVRNLLVHTLGYGLVASVAMWVCAPALPWLLGPSFAPAADAARWLCLSPLLSGLCSVGTSVLLTRNCRNQRIAAQCAGIATLVVAGLALIPGHGLAGAVITLLSAQAATAAAAWYSVLRSKP